MQNTSVSSQPLQVASTPPSPAPWLWAEDQEHALSIWSGQKLIALKENAQAEDKANFILMRAAPRLLAALREMVRLAPAISQVKTGAYEEAVAAIAEAEQS